MNNLPLNFLDSSVYKFFVNVDVKLLLILYYTYL